MDCFLSIQQINHPFLLKTHLFYLHRVIAGPVRWMILGCDRWYPSQGVCMTIPHSWCSILVQDRTYLQEHLSRWCGREHQDGHGSAVHSRRPKVGALLEHCIAALSIACRCLALYSIWSLSGLRPWTMGFYLTYSAPFLKCVLVIGSYWSQFLP